MRFLPRSGLQMLIDRLGEQGYTCMGPQVRDQVIHYDVLQRADNLPRGMSDTQKPGHYRLEEAGHARYFAWANGPQALKPLMFSPREPLWQASRGSDGRMDFEQCLPEKKTLAVIGVRACDIAALYIHDKHFLQHGHADPAYRSRREGLFLVAVNCTHPAATCFCASTGDGPAASYGYDLLLTELDAGFLLQAHTEKGLAVVKRLDLEEANRAQISEAEQAMARSQRQQRRLPSKNLDTALQRNLEHPRWQEIAGRCLSCGNCTSVCPTCFCHSEVEEAALDGSHSVHFRQWDSCFSQKHSYIHGLTIRADTGLRYRQWMMHKLGFWHAQFGRSGCVGCGRCISWCPAGIDFTEEAGIICAAGEEGEGHD